MYGLEQYGCESYAGVRRHREKEKHQMIKLTDHLVFGRRNAVIQS